MQKGDSPLSPHFHFSNLLLPFTETSSEQTEKEGERTDGEMCGGSPSEYHYVFGTTCVFMKPEECVGVGEGFKFGKWWPWSGEKEKKRAKTGGKIQSSAKRIARRSILEGNNEKAKYA